MDLATAEACRPSFAASWLGEWDDFWRSGDEAAHAPCCGNLPLLVISQDPDRPKPGWDARSLAANPIWAGLQENLKKLSPRSRRIIARNSGHHIMTDRPDVIINNVREVVLNLIFNAVDAMPDGGMMEIGARAEIECGCFWVADSGCGMSPETASRIS